MTSVIVFFCEQGYVCISIENSFSIHSGFETHQQKSKTTIEQLTDSNEPTKTYIIEFLSFTNITISGRSRISQRGAPILAFGKISVKNCMKMIENGRSWGRGTSLVRPLGSANDYVSNTEGKVYPLLKELSIDIW